MFGIIIKMYNTGGWLVFLKTCYSQGNEPTPRKKYYG